MMSFLFRTWYFAGWAERLAAGSATGVKIADMQIALYRTEAGAIVAVGDRCPHRFAPLHLGKVKGDALECPYHGLQFGVDGGCVFSPHNSGAIPRTARVATYPVIERDGAIWLWLAEDAEPDATRVPDLSALGSFPSASRNDWQLEVEANYELIVDNLLDATHADFVHAGTLGNGEASNQTPQVTVDGDEVTIEWAFKGKLGLPYLAHYVAHWDQVDSWIKVRWTPPAVIRLEIGVTKMGAERSEGIITIAYHLVMPQDGGRTSYVVAGVRNHDYDDPATSEMLQKMVGFAFSQQDKPIIEAQQRMMGDAEFWDLRPLLLPSDKAAVQVRRKLQSLIAAEAQPDGPPVVSRFPTSA